MFAPAPASTTVVNAHQVYRRLMTWGNHGGHASLSAAQCYEAAETMARWLRARGYMPLDSGELLPLAA